MGSLLAWSAGYCLVGGKEAIADAQVWVSSPDFWPCAIAIRRQGRQHGQACGRRSGNANVVRPVAAVGGAQRRKSAWFWLIGGDLPVACKPNHGEFETDEPDLGRNSSLAKYSFCCSCVACGLPPGRYAARINPWSTMADSRGKHDYLGPEETAQALGWFAAMDTNR